MKRYVGYRSIIQKKSLFFFSWDKDSFTKYAQVEIDNFNALWDDNKKRNKVFELDSYFYEKVKDNVNLELLRNEIFSDGLNLNISKEEDSIPFFNYSFAQSNQELLNVDFDTRLPSKPLTVKGHPFELFPHQVEAIKSWKNSDYKGLFKLATGSGKTFTSISAIVELYEERKKSRFRHVCYS
ncbi:DEAD/DEAH box helicase family protein [Photobacterium angustum]|uniref:DEAD/DEAH box helicase family protein n=1 Tax=Photobacterium angustum TaxID=661 RepID=UPI00191C5A86